MKNKWFCWNIFNYFIFIYFLILLNNLCEAQTSDDFYQVSPNNFYNLDSEQQQQFPCPPYGMCDFGVENNQNLFSFDNFPFNSKSFLPRPSSQNQFLAFNGNNNEFPTLIPPNKIKEGFTDSPLNKIEESNIAKQEINNNDIGSNGCNGGNWGGEIKDVSLQRSVPAPFPPQMSNIPKNTFNLEELYGTTNLNNENILNNYGSNINYYQSQGNYGGYSSGNNNFIYGEIPYDFDMEGRDEEEEEEGDDWNENEQKSAGTLIGEAAAHAVLGGISGMEGREREQMRRTLIDNNKNNYFKLDEQPYIGYLNILNKKYNIENNNLPNIWQSGGGKKLYGSSSPSVAPFVGLETSLQGIDKNPCQQSINSFPNISPPQPPTINNNNLLDSSKSLLVNSPTISSSQFSSNTSNNFLENLNSSNNSNNHHYVLRGLDIPFPFGIGNNPSNQNKEEQHQHQQPIQKSVTSIQALTQQILRLPAVLYADSRSSGSRKLEALLREVYGLPLVTFYVDIIGNGKPRLVERNLEQLTAHRGLPYLFICGTFIGSKEHIQNYHEKHQIPQLVEYVCNGEDKRETTNFNENNNNSTTTNLLNKTLTEKQQ